MRIVRSFPNSCVYEREDKLFTNQKIEQDYYEDESKTQPLRAIYNNLHNNGDDEIKPDRKGERDMPTIVHFQIPSDNIERSKKLYGNLFGWKFDKFPPPTGSVAMPEGMEYWMISTVDDKGKEALSGGMMKRQSPEQQGITNYFDVKSVQEYAAKVEQLGGKVISPKMPVTGMGYFAVCTDTENNGFGIFEVGQTAK